MGKGADIVGIAEMDELAVDEFRIGGDWVCSRHGHRRIGLVVDEPRLSVIGTLLVKGEREGLVRGIVPDVLDFVELLEPLSGLGGGRRAQPLVVLDVPAGHGIRGPPGVQLLGRVKGMCRGALGDLEEGRLERTQESLLEKGGPFRVKHIHDETLDVAPVMILVGHNHDPAVSEFCQGLVDLAVLEAQNTLNRGEFLIVVEFLDGNVPDIEELASEGKYAPSLSADHGQAGDGGCCG